MNAESHSDALESLQAENEQLRQELNRARRRLTQLEASVDALQHELKRAVQFRRRIEESITWSAFQAVRGRLFAAAGGEESRGVRAVQATLRVLAGKRRPRVPNDHPLVRLPRRRFAHRRLEFPQIADPVVSIVVPVFRRADLTKRCLESVAAFTSGVSYEVIVIDDGADSQNKRALRSLSGARVITNQSNLGYLRSINRAAATARGRWLVLANNDIEVQPGWLEALVACGESSDDVAVVAPMYVYPDGRLNEAGAVVWSDGTGANYGRGDQSASWRYSYRREIDYASAAALLVRRDFWEARGGYDERFLPMYYEDTDLCFDAREKGFRVLYEPEARVIHLEGATAGTNLSSGHKRHQEENRARFVAKWRRRLETGHAPPRLRPGPGDLRSAAHTHVLIADHRVPTPDRDSGSLRMMAIVEILREMGCRVTFLPDNLSPVQPYTTRLTRLGVEVIYGPVDPAVELRAVGRFDVALLSRPYVGARWLGPVLGAAPHALTIYDTVDLHWLREARRYQHENGTEATELGPEAVLLRETELRLVRETDITFVVSEFEREQVKADVPEADVRVIPNVHRLREQVPPHDQRSGLLFVGGFEHDPNVEAVLRVVNGVMPHVWREHPEARVTIVGADAPREILALQAPRVNIAGWVADLEPLLDSSLALLAPLTYGAGVKGKITEAMAAGLPVVTTSTGAEGLDAVDGEHLIVADDDRGLAAAVVRLMADQDLWQRLSTQGSRLVDERFSVDVVRDRLEALLGLDATAQKDRHPDPQSTHGAEAAASRTERADA
jgi:GT2 family glycosyltransferase